MSTRNTRKLLLYKRNTITIERQCTIDGQLIEFNDEDDDLLEEKMETPNSQNPDVWEHWYKDTGNRFSDRNVMPIYIAYGTRCLNLEITQLGCCLIKSL